MRIAINTRFLIKDKLEGIGWFTYETVSRITRMHPEHEFIFLFDRDFDESFLFSGNVEPKIVFPPARHPLLWYYWFELSLPRVLREVNADVFLSPDGYLSLRASTPTLLVVHDLAFEHYSDHVSKSVLWYYRKYSPKYVYKAKRIATVSQATKRDICDSYKVSPEKIDVIHNGANPQFKPLSEEQQLAVRKRYFNGKPYFIYVGAVHPRKNVENLLLAYDRYRRGGGNRKLLIAGRKAWKTSSLEQTYEQMEFKDDVLFTGHLLIQELSGAVAASDALLYPSLLEGFGIPVLEGIYCEVPVITSNRSSMPEVAGDAALLIDPFSINELAAAKNSIEKDPKIRRDLIQKSRERKKLFSWDRSASLLWESLEKVMIDTM